ncbi:MAG: hypothetical protein AAGJ79_11520, partial [Verrucomicrobiota bacterium]
GGLRFDPDGAAPSWGPWLQYGSYPTEAAAQFVLDGNVSYFPDWQQQLVYDGSRAAHQQWVLQYRQPS